MYLAQDKSRRRMVARVMLTAMAVGWSSSAAAQRAGDNALKAAPDAFGSLRGDERVGLYTESDVRGFSPTAAGNVRLDGLYFDLRGFLSGRISQSITVKVGVTAQSEPFPAPTGVVDYRLLSAAGPAAGGAFMQAGPNGSWRVEADGHAPLSETLAVGGGASYRVFEPLPGDYGKYWAHAAYVYWNPTPGVTVEPFWTRLSFGDDRAMPIITPAATATALPPHPPRRYWGQDWAVAKGFTDVSGVRLHAIPAQSWDVRGGLFYANYHRKRDYADLYSEADPAGLARHFIVAVPDQGYESVSGELRVLKTWSRPSTIRSVVLAVRGRSLDSRYGGADTRSYGPARIGVREVLAEPSYAFRAQTDETVRQVNLGAAYAQRWQDRAALNLGIQSVSYRREVTVAGRLETTRSRVWLYNGSAQVSLMPTLSVFGDYTRGLEDSGSVPENAANFPSALPAVRTSQAAAGLRWSPDPRAKLLLGAFSVKKPYFGFDGSRVFTEIGEVNNRGIEASLTGAWGSRLNYAVGMLALDPRVRAPGNGSHAVGTPRFVLRANAEHRPRWARGAAFGVAVAHTGRTAVTFDNRLEADPYTIIDLSVRYPFEVHGHRATVRVQANNITNAFGWRVRGAGGLLPNEPRGIALYLAADL